MSGEVPLSVDAARAQSRRSHEQRAARSEPVARVLELRIAGAGGEVPARAYLPSASTGLPVVVFQHGGGWVVGGFDSIDGTCRRIANGTGFIVVTSEYRLAPEHKFPAAAEDTYATVRWVAENASAINGDPSRIAIGGSSAGGNLAAAVALMARDRGGPPLAFQLLAQPILEHSFATVSYRENAEGHGLTRAKMEWYWDQYLASVADGENPYASPLLAPDLRGLPPAHVITSELDPLRDEGNAYVARLRAAGVPVTHRLSHGTGHGLLSQAESGGEAAAALDEAIARLREAFPSATG